MSLEALTWAFKQTLKPAQKIVLLALADYADDENRCWPAMKTLAEKSSLSERAVRVSIRSLEEIGYLTTEMRTRPNGSQTSNVYWLNLPGGAADPAGAPSPGTTPPEPSSNPQVNTPPTPRDDERFASLWLVWPKKVEKAAALRAWNKLTATQKNDALQRMVTYANAMTKNTPPRFYKNLSTMLRDERWLEDPPVGEDRGARNPEPSRPAPITIPPGHRAIWSDEGYIIGSEPA